MNLGFDKKLSYVNRPKSFLVVQVCPIGNIKLWGLCVSWYLHLTFYLETCGVTSVRRIRTSFISAVFLPICSFCTNARSSIQMTLKIFARITLTGNLSVDTFFVHQGALLGLAHHHIQILAFVTGIIITRCQLLEPSHLTPQVVYIHVFIHQ